MKPSHARDSRKVAPTTIPVGRIKIGDSTLCPDLPAWYSYSSTFLPTSDPLGM